MALAYSNASSGDKAIAEIQKIVRGFGCSKFGVMTDDADQTVCIQFEHRGQLVSFKASARGYAVAWLKENPYNSRRKCTAKEHEKKAIEVGSIAVYSILRDLIKGNIAAVESGVLSFQSAFLGQLMLPDGRTVNEYVQTQKFLPAPKDEA